jgi:cyclopropane fatty-acyl-phospholipid synthase-like methyltransferase
MPPTLPCKICSQPASFSGIKTGAFQERDFRIYQCANCLFSFVGNPWTDFAEIYSEAYYKGLGADPRVSYLHELESPERSIRQYEWRGLLEIAGSLRSLDKTVKWLDFGCGNGGLVRYVKQHTAVDIAGFEEGWIADRAASMGIPILSSSELDTWEGQADIITAIEVIEHVIDPVDFLRKIKSLLKPGGIFFLTTGNARPFREKIIQWAYVIPEIHVSFFEPATLALAFEKAGLRPEYKGFIPGFADVIRFKVLKNLGQREISLPERLLPWSLLSPMVDKKYGISHHPIGIR